jgi:hypothetical protein
VPNKLNNLDSTGPSFKGIHIKILIPFFVEFFEEARPWLDANEGRDFIAWPNIWQFGRLVRNAASHNRLSFNDPKLAPVTWHKLTYGRSQHGRAIFGKDLAFADLLVLMIVMSDSLDALGAPF